MLLTQEIKLPEVTTTEPVVTDLPEITMPVTTARYQDAIPDIPYATVIEPEKPVTASETVTTEATTTAE